MGGLNDDPRRTFRIFGIAFFILLKVSNVFKSFEDPPPASRLTVFKFVL